MHGIPSAGTRSSLDRSLSLRLTLVMVVSGAVQLALLGLSIDRRFDALELESTMDDLGRLDAALEAEHASIRELARDYSGWDDARDYALGVRPGFPEENFYADWMTVSGVSRVLVLDARAVVLWSSRLYGDGVHSVAGPGDELPDGLRPGSRSALLAGAPMDRPLSFASRSGGDILLDCAYPITDSRFTGPPVGWIRFSRPLDGDMLERIAERVGLDLRFSDYSEAREAREIGLGNLTGSWYDAGGERRILLPVLDPDGDALATLEASRTRRLDLPALRLLMDMLAMLVLSTAAMALIVLSLVRRRVVRPLERVSLHLEGRTGDGELGERLAMGAAAGRRDEIGSVADRIDGLFEVLARRNAELGEANEELTRLAGLDHLTGLPNRRFFDESAGREVRRIRRESRERRNAGSLALVMADIDHFKAFNDRYGHREGDRCLRLVAEALAACANRPGDLPCRFGGEEFIVLLPDTDLEGAAIVAEHIRRAVEELAIPHQSSPTADRVTLSLGVACSSPSGSLDLELLITRADAALYLAKNQGRNRVEQAG